MSLTLTPEQLVLVVLVGLLYGPTAIWLAYRALRGLPSRSSRVQATPPEPEDVSRRAPDHVEALVQDGAYWVCETCRSVVRREAGHCYRCRAARPRESGPAIEQPAATDWVPVMSSDLAGSGGAVAATQAPGVVSGLPAPATLAGPLDPAEPVGPGAASGNPAVCPYLGFKDDPSSRCDYPDPRNVCHAASRGTGEASRRRPGATAKRSRPVAIEHQESHCLTAAHPHCALYPAVEVLAGRR